MVFSFTFATIILTICAWKLLNWVWLKPKKLEKFLRQQGFSGNSYKLFIGDTQEISRMTKEVTSRPISFADHIVLRIRPFEHHLMSKYGNKNCFIWLGSTPQLIITDPSLIKEILIKHEMFPKPHVSPLAKLFAGGLVIYEGEKWHKVRKIANPAFHMDKLKDMVPKIYKSCDDLIEKWKNLVSKDTKSCELDVWPDIQNFTADVISRTAFGSNFETGRKIFEIIREQRLLLNQVVQRAYIPGWWFLPTATNRKMKSNYKKLVQLVRGIITKREEALKAGESRNDDLLGLLIESNYQAIEQKEAGMSMEEVIDECRLFYNAGQGTTASLLVWTLVLLSIHPDWQQRAREEVLQVLGNGNKSPPTFNDLNQLKVVTKIFSEVQRLYPSLPCILRRTDKERKLGQVVLPAGVMLLLPIFLLHRDEEYWGDDAKEFNPNRFSEGVLKASKSNQVSFFPFSWGPRICIGQNFAMLEEKLALAMILQNFSFKLSPTYAHAPFEKFLLLPQYGARLILHKI